MHRPAFAIRAWIHRSAVSTRWRTAADARALQAWIRGGRQSPPPHAAKQELLRATSREHGLRTLVETGTFMGDMVAAMLREFDSVHTIELAPHLAAAARRRFRAVASVTVHEGDSGAVLPAILRTIDRPTLFWLDGHWSAGVTARGDRDTPIVGELDAIFGHPLARSHAILVDDARLFDGRGDYPRIDEIERRCCAAGIGPVRVADDVIRIGPTGG